jgi:hypothetical protein
MNTKTGSRPTARECVPNRRTDEDVEPNKPTRSHESTYSDHAAAVRLIERNASCAHRGAASLPPWQGDEITKNFKIVDATSQALPMSISKMSLADPEAIDRDEARRIASNMGKLPDLFSAIPRKSDSTL